MKTALVTGGAGFIGSNLCERLIREKKNVICLDNLSTGSLDNLRNVKNDTRFSFVRGDVRNRKLLDSILRKEKVDSLFHYAAVVGVKRTLEHPLEVLEDIEGTKAVLDAARAHDVSRVVYASSSEVYGHPAEIPEREDGHVNAKLPYAVTKLMSEKYMEAYFHTHGLRTTSLRFFNVYGPRQEATPYGFVVGIFIKQALAGTPLTIFGDGTQTRDFTYIEDNIDATLACLPCRAAEGQTINIGTGKPTTIYDLAEMVLHLAGSKKSHIKFLPERPDEIKHRFPDVTMMRKILSFRPRFTLERGLKETISWYAANGYTVHPTKRRKA